MLKMKEKNYKLIKKKGNFNIVPLYYLVLKWVVYIVRIDNVHIYINLICGPHVLICSIKIYENN